jgi:hypothetical protein
MEARVQTPSICRELCLGGGGGAHYTVETIQEYCEVLIAYFPSQQFLLYIYIYSIIKN